MQRSKSNGFREVTPNAAVVDTGYTGSIINTIKEIDPGVSGYLMHSNRPKVYPKASPARQMANQRGLTKSKIYPN